MMHIRWWVAVMWVVGSVASAAGAAGLEKKLILHSWDMKSPADLAENAGRLQHAPFDGLTVRCMPFCYSFYNRDVDEAVVAENVEAMSRIKWGKFTDNLMYLVPGDNIDWFDETAWADDGFILQNVRAIARMGLAGGCRGILYNPEFVYWGRPHDPWDYRTQARREQRSVAEYRAMVRKRGTQVINAIEQYMPDTTFLALYWGVYYSPVARIAAETDPEVINQIIADAPHYGLLHDFMLGILEGADRGTTIIDGNEYAYYRRRPEDFNRDYHFIRQTMLGAVPQELRYKYRAQVAVGHAIYADVHSNTRGKADLSTFMTLEERGLGLERVVYNALKNSDRYAWMHTEKPQYLNNVRAPREMAAAIDRARLKIARNEELGFDFTPIEEKAGRAYNEMKGGTITPSKAEIGHAVGRPRIDGRLDDEAWKTASKLGPFQNFRMASEGLQTRTIAYMAYDGTNLYVGFRCDDPLKQKLAASEIDKEHEERGGGDMVEVGIAADEEATRYYHVRLTHENRRWDSLTPAGTWPNNEISGKNSSWDGEYETAIHVAEDFAFWSVEIAIPWSTLNRQAPRPGDRLKGNLIRRTDSRASHGSRECSTWSQRRINRCVEAATLGTWQFK